MCFMNQQGWASAERALLSMKAYNNGLAELTGFATLLMTIDKALKGAIERVVKNIVAKGKKMHKLNEGKDGERMKE
jgi:hypothetical protein